MSYREENGLVVLTMTREDYQRVIFALGMAAGEAREHGGDLSPHLDLMNRLNEGNPAYTPYAIPPAPAST